MEDKLLTVNELYEFLTGGDKMEITLDSLYGLELKLKEGLDLDKQDEDGNCLLHKYALKDDFLSVELLVKAKCNLNLQNKNKETPLIVAIKNKSTRSTTALCQGSKF